MVTVILIFLGASLLLYGLLGGADFGAGIVELFSPQKMQSSLEKAVYKAMGPVWEANHMWLILAVVILFNGFPKIYAEIAIVLHVPLTFLLLGIILRGCAFTFRHYDTVADGSTKLYSLTFKYSSLLSSFLLGTISGALVKGQFLMASSGQSYLQTYWLPWTSPFCFSVGVFACLLFAYQAAAFLTSEPLAPTVREHCQKLARRFLAAAVLSGAVCFLFASLEGFNLLEKFLKNPLTLACLLVATVLLVPTVKALATDRPWLLRGLLGLQVSSILVGWMTSVFPDILRYQDGTSLGMLDWAAGPSTQAALLGALVVGSIFIFPALFLLFGVFKRTAPYK